MLSKICLGRIHGQALHVRLDRFRKFLVICVNIIKVEVSGTLHENLGARGIKKEARFKTQVVSALVYLFLLLCRPLALPCDSICFS